MSQRYQKLLLCGCTGKSEDVMMLTPRPFVLEVCGGREGRWGRYIELHNFVMVLLCSNIYSLGARCVVWTCLLCLSCVCVQGRWATYIAQAIIAFRLSLCPQDWILPLSSMYLLLFLLPSSHCRGPHHPPSLWVHWEGQRPTHGQHQCLCHCEGDRLSLCGQGDLLFPVNRPQDRSGWR